MIYNQEIFSELDNLLAEKWAIPISFIFLALSDLFTFSLGVGVIDSLILLNLSDIPYLTFHKSIWGAFSPSFSRNLSISTRSFKTSQDGFCFWMFLRQDYSFVSVVFMFRISLIDCFSWMKREISSGISLPLHLMEGNLSTFFFRPTSRLWIAFLLLSPSSLSVLMVSLLALTSSASLSLSFLQVSSWLRMLCIYSLVGFLTFSSYSSLVLSTSSSQLRAVMVPSYFLSTWASLYFLRLLILRSTSLMNICASWQMLSILRTSEFLSGIRRDSQVPITDLDLYSRVRWTSGTARSSFSRAFYFRSIAIIICWSLGVLVMEIKWIWQQQGVLGLGSWRQVDVLTTDAKWSRVGGRLLLMTTNGYECNIYGRVVQVLQQELLEHPRLEKRQPQVQC